MKLLSVILFATLAAIAVAQSIAIGYPPANTHIKQGRPLTVQVELVEIIDGPSSIGIAVGISTCIARPCAPPIQFVGEHLLYTGPYLPLLHRQDPRGGFYQNFTVQIPPLLPMGEAQLNVVFAGVFDVRYSPNQPIRC
ncbi:hypothetical protein F5887DRAFT_1135213 [Amanita rubescens]|nr:hypothetical protein F5887DRAFT_1135213 [Amanita rubescens]